MFINLMLLIIIMWLILLSGILIIAITYFDTERKTIPDILTLGLWTIVFLYSPVVYHTLLVAIFLAFWVFVEVFSPLFNKDKPLFGWGDILLFPPFFVLCEVMVGGNTALGSLYASLFAVIPLFWSKWKGKGVPVALPVLIGFCLLLMAKLFYAVVTSS